MKSWMNRMGLLGMTMVVTLLIGTVCAMAQETQYASGSTSAALTFGPAVGRTVVDSVYATTDKEDGAVAFYARGSAGKVAPSATPTNGQVVISVANASFDAAAGMTTNDRVVYVHANGVCDYRTVAGSATNSVTLSSGISVAGATGDYLYEVTQQGAIVVGFDGAATNAADTVAVSGRVYVTPADSPLYIVLDGTAACKLMATVTK